MVESFNYEGIEFPVSKRVITKLKQKISVLRHLDMKIIKPVHFIY